MTIESTLVILMLGLVGIAMVLILRAGLEEGFPGDRHDKPT